jgi:hypothetical protein
MQAQSSLPEPEEFQTPVYGTVFAGRTDVVHRLQRGDPLILVPDPPGVDDPNVWVHARGGDVVGHLRPDIGASLSQWMLGGGRCAAWVWDVGGDDVASWRRLVIRVRRHPG